MLKMIILVENFSYSWTGSGNHRKFFLTDFGKQHLAQFTGWFNKIIKQGDKVFVGSGRHGGTQLCAKSFCNSIQQVNSFTTINGLDGLNCDRTEEPFRRLIDHANENGADIAVGIYSGAGMDAEGCESVKQKLLRACIEPGDFQNKVGATCKIIRSPEKVLELVEELSKLCKK